MPRTLTERVTVLETDYKITIDDIKDDLHEVKTDVRTMALEMPELIRRQSEHHAVFHDHSRIINDLKDAECPARKVMPEDNGDRKRRKLDAPKFKYMRYALFVSIAGLIASNVATCAWVAKNVSTILDSMPK